MIRKCLTLNIERLGLEFMAHKQHFYLYFAEYMKISAEINTQRCGSRMYKHSDPGSGIRDEHPGTQFEFFGLKLLKFFDADPDPYPGSCQA